MHVKISDMLQLQQCSFGLKFVFSSDPKTGDNFTCTCMEGFEGPYCNKPYCLEQPCQKEGSCDLRGGVSQMGHLASHRVVVLLVRVKMCYNCMTVCSIIDS
jgi:hypothetical protein